MYRAPLRRFLWCALRPEPTVWQNEPREYSKRYFARCVVTPAMTLLLLVPRAATATCATCSKTRGALDLCHTLVSCTDVVLPFAVPGCGFEARRVTGARAAPCGALRRLVQAGHLCGSSWCAERVGCRVPGAPVTRSVAETRHSECQLKDIDLSADPGE